MIYFKVINRYGKAVTIKLKDEEMSQFKTRDFARKICQRLNEDEFRPRWLVNRVDWKANRPYTVDVTKI
jgi:hypothetical protein